MQISWLMRVVRRRWLALCAASVVLYGDGGLAGSCAPLGVDAPSVVTLMASRTDPARGAWIVSPDCSVKKETLFNDGLGPLSYEIDRVDSLPTGATSVILVGNPLSSGADFSKADKLTVAIFEDFSPKLLDKLLLPSTVNFLTMINSPFTSLASLRLPPALVSLSLVNNALTSLEDVRFPSSLSSIYIGANKLTSIDFEMPPQLQSLTINANPISKLEKISFPNAIGSIDLRDNAISVIQGVEWPLSLSVLHLIGNPIVKFEIRETDRKAMSQLLTFAADFTSLSCTLPARAVVARGKKICAISDQLFAYLYRGGSNPGTTDSTASPSESPVDPKGIGGKSTGSAGSQGSEDTSTGPGEVNSAGSFSQSPSDSTTSKSVTSSNGSEPLDDGYSAESDGPPLSRRPHQAASASGPVSSTTELNSGSSSGSAFLVIGIVGGSIVALLLAFTGYRVYIRSRKPPEDESGDWADEKATSRNTVTKSFHYATEPADDVYLTNDIRIDRALIPFRIELQNVAFGEQIAQGKASAIYRATFQGRDVAVKQLLPGVWQNERALASFMAEIRMCSSLEHHKIVAFLGIAWTSARDISIVTEFMAGGDLNTLLLKQQEVPKGREWFEPWTSVSITCKALIAQDVAEALVYLHSFKKPILHRNLKSHNVLLDHHGNAKLSDFGISRVSTFDETMTGEVGTAAWIAPEVLRGERYSEQADIYSLGVLLVELDRCRHPFASEIPAPRETEASSGETVPPQISYKNTQIAVLVSSGKLRPSVSSSCPASVASLVDKCLSFDAASRPTAMGVYYSLRQSRKALGQSVSMD